MSCPFLISAVLILLCQLYVYKSLSKKRHGLSQNHFPNNRIFLVRNILSGEYFKQKNQKQPFYNSDGREYYYVSWKGYPINQATWEPITNMGNCSALILQYQLKNLSNNDKKQLCKAMQSEDEFQQETFHSSPCNIYQHNLQLITGNVNLIQNFNKRISYLQKIINEKLPDGAEIIEIVRPQLGYDIQTPTHFFVKIKDSSINRLYKVQKQTMIKHYRLKLIEYYQSLIQWNP